MAMKGKDAHLRRLAKLRKVESVATAVVYEGADMIRAEAFVSISRGSVSGKKHVASAPGQPPNRMNGDLQAGLQTVKILPLEAEVRSEAAHGRPLEFGTSKMAARPYMRPAREKMKPKIEALFANAMNKHVRDSGK